MQPVLINGEWRSSQGTESFRAMNPNRREPLPDEFPISPWEEIDDALAAATRACAFVSGWPGERFARFLDQYATRIESRAEALVEAAHLETALPIAPRLKDVELPRTINQLRQGAQAARQESWRLPVIDTAANIRSMFAAIGPVAVFGPNNFPFAFNSIAGGDFTAAVASGNPVIAKGHPSHPKTTQLFAQAAHEAAQASEMGPGFVQLIYRTSHADGAKLVSDPRLGATGYTGGRQTGLVLKEAADRAGKPIYLELSSINPVFILPGALQERFDAIVNDFVTSALMGAGQFCTNPGLVILNAGPNSERFIQAVADRFQSTPPGTLLGEGTERNLRAGIDALLQTGAKVVVGNQPADSTRCCYSNTLLRVTAAEFLKNPRGLQQEAFGNCSLIIVADGEFESAAVANQVEGNLTGCVYSSTTGEDDQSYKLIAKVLHRRVGRLLNDNMPTGVAVSPAMNHGGPYPATGHPGFTAVGIPASLRRFASLQCYDNVREHRLPDVLKNKNPTGQTWRSIDGVWTREDVPFTRT